MVSEAAEIGPNGGGGEEGRVRTRREETGEKVQEGKGRRFNLVSFPFFFTSLMTFSSSGFAHGAGEGRGGARCWSLEGSCRSRAWAFGIR